MSRASLAVGRPHAVSGSVLKHACSKQVMLCLRRCLLWMLLGLVEVMTRAWRLQPQALLQSKVIFQAEQTALELCSIVLEGHCQ